MKFSIFIYCLLFVSLSFGQLVRGPIANPAPGVLDGVYVKENIPTKKVIPYEFVREADVTWSKRVWRVIDLREKFNLPLYYPLDDIDFDAPDDGWQRNTSRWSLWTIIRHHVMTGDLTIYSPFHPEWQAWSDGDLFKYPITSELYGSAPGLSYSQDSIFREYVKGMEYLGAQKFNPNPTAIESIEFPGSDSVDALGETMYYPEPFVWIESEDIVQYKIKEDWFFDKERSVLDVRIIGIAPVVYERSEDGTIKGVKELFWLYFPECRYVFQNFFVQSRHNDSQRMSFDDLFWKRMFHSYIEKESNLYNREIDTYRSGINALLESEKIKENIFRFEHDLWSF